MIHLNFFLAGDFPTVTAQMKGVTVVNGKPRFYKKQEVKDAEDWFRAGLLPHRPKLPLDSPVRLEVEWRFPTADPKRYGTYKKTRPDTDNLEKILKDVMTECNFWVDDARVVHEIVGKVWSDKPGVWIDVTELNPVRLEPNGCSW